MLIFRFIILFWVTTRIGLQALVLQKHIGFLKLSSAASLYPASSDWSAHTRLTQHRQQQQSSYAKSILMSHSSHEE